VGILISDKIDLKIKKITRDKEGHYIMIKRSIQEEDITTVNVYAPQHRSMCLLVGAFNPFTFKVIIDIYVPMSFS